MVINDDDLHRRSLLFEDRDERKSGRNDWSSPSPESEESSEMESASFQFNSYVSDESS